jgi:hypothetical protein
MSVPGERTPIGMFECWIVTYGAVGRRRPERGRRPDGAGGVDATGRADADDGADATGVTDASGVTDVSGRAGATGRPGGPDAPGRTDGTKGLPSHSPDTRTGIGLSCSLLSQRTGPRIKYGRRPRIVPAFGHFFVGYVSEFTSCVVRRPLWHGPPAPFCRESHACRQLTPPGDLPLPHSPFGPFKIGPAGGVALCPPSVTSSTGGGEYAVVAVGEPRFRERTAPVWAG